MDRYVVSVSMSILFVFACNCFCSRLLNEGYSDKDRCFLSVCRGILTYAYTLLVLSYLAYAFVH